MAHVPVDTDILIDYLRGYDDAVRMTPNVRHYPMFDALEPAYRR